VNYLGGRISLFTSLTIGGLEEDFRTTFQRVEYLVLKTHQKYQFISTCLIPHFLYSLVLTTVPVITIHRLDQELNRVVRSIFDLLHCTSNGLLYYRKRDRGLGIPKPETIIISSSLRTGYWFFESTDPVM
jgi:hypothetical protein